MKVAAVSVMCQDQRVFDAMMNAGTPCPKDGLIGEEAKLAWEQEELRQEVSAATSEEEDGESIGNKKAMGVGTVAGVLALLLAL